LRALAGIPARRVRHLPEVLYHWRQSPGSMSVTRAEACRDAAVRSLQDHLGERGRVRIDPARPLWPEVRFNLPSPAPKLSIVTASPADGVGNGYYDPTKLEHVAAAADATGDVLIFVHARLRPRSTDWLGELAAQASREEIGAAGARLSGPDGKVIHAGYVLHRQNVAESPASEADLDDPGYRGQFWLPRTVSAVSGDCLAVRRDVYEAAGGFTQAAGDYADVDFSLRLRARGLLTVWTPHAWLQFTTAPKRRRAGKMWMQGRWAGALEADPFFNPNLRLANGRLSLGRK
jgi:hypothetical protein